MLPKLALSRFSFRRQILLLGVVVVVLLLAVLFATFSALQYTRSAVLRDDQKRLAELTTALVQQYNDSPLSQSNNRLGLLENASAESSRNALADVAQTVLGNVDAVEGGFYAANGDTLVSYSSPARSTPAVNTDNSDINAAERSSIMQVAREAVSSRTVVARVLAVGSDFALVNAAPIHNGGQIVGSAWTMKLLLNIPGTNRLRTYLIAVVLGLAALACVLLTLFVVHALQNGVRKIEDGLKSLEQTLSSQISVESDPEEIRKIAEAINRLASALKAKIDAEKQIEDRLRHAERLAALGRLIAGVAHEVRNPLATIRLRVQMCQDSGNLDVQESCVVALQEIERLNEMVSRLLSFSRPVRLHTEATSLERLVEQRLSNFADVARQHQIRFITRFNGHPATIPVDQNRLGQVFDNVIQNAIEAMSSSGGTLCVNVASEPKGRDGTREFAIEFNDTGEGIPSDVLGRIFDPFFTTKSAGTGLGLSICHELIQAHGGKIEIASAEGCGTTVRILLPLRDRAVAGNVA